jgi:hypothetical protein
MTDDFKAGRSEGRREAFAKVVAHVRDFRLRREVSGDEWLPTEADVELIRIVELCGAERE